MLKYIPRGLEPSPSGLRADHLQVNEWKHRKFYSLATELSLSAQRAIFGDLPVGLARWLCRWRGVHLRKKNVGVRPLVVGEVIRAAISNFVVQRCSAAAQDTGLAGRTAWLLLRENGIQAAICTARFWVNHLNGNVIRKVDISNVFQLLCKVVSCQSVPDQLPTLLNAARG